MISKTKDTVVYKRGEDYVRSTIHHFDTYINSGKNAFIDKFIDEYIRVTCMCMEELWENGYTWVDTKNRTRNIHLKLNKISDGPPQYLNKCNFNCLDNYNGLLSGRMLSNALNQLAGIVRGIVKSAISTKTDVVKPNLLNITPEIPPKMIDMCVNPNDGSIFDEYITLINFTKKKKENITIPIRTHAMDHKFTVDGNRLKSISLSRDRIVYRYQFSPSKNDKELVVGGDMGMNKILTTSDGQMTSKTDSQGKTLGGLLEKVNRKESGSKAQKRCIREIECFTQEVINRLDFTDFGVFKLESNKGLKLNTGNSNHHWSTTTITDKILKKCQENHVDFLFTPSPYKSQRCFGCGFTHKNNRHGEKFVCLNCRHIDDADNNSSLNNSLDLPCDCLWSYRNLNKSCGFFWTENGIILNDNDKEPAFLGSK